MTLKIDLKLLFDGYCRNFTNIYDNKYHWTKKEGFTWLTHSILRFFRGLGESLGFDVAFDKKNIGNVELLSRGDLIWVKDEEPILHLECENADVFRDITEELENLGNSDIPYKVGVFQLTHTSLKGKTVGRTKRFLDKKKLLKKGTRWLLIFDIWNDIRIENVEYQYEAPKTFDTVQRNYELEYYPLIGMILGEKIDKIKRAKIFCLPFEKIGVFEEKWEKL